MEHRLGCLWTSPLNTPKYPMLDLYINENFGKMALWKIQTINNWSRG
jgi:hypothetical protein